MQKLTSLLISCLLALAGAALAQQPVEQQSPSKGKRAPEKARAPQAQPRPNAAKAETPAAKQHGAMKGPPAANQPGAMKERGATNQRGAVNEPGAGKGRKTPAPQGSANTPETNVSGKPAGAESPTARQQRIEERRKGMKGSAAGAPKTNPPAPAAAGAAGAASSRQVTGQQNVQPNAGGKAKKPAPEQVQQIK